jgi:hypothetical protein
MKFSFWSVPLVLVIFLFSACGPTDSNEKFMNGVNKEIAKNYQDNKAQFDKLDEYFKLSHIKYIEITENGMFNITYVTDTSTKEIELPYQDTGYTTLKNALSLDHLTSGDLLNIKKHLESININIMSLIDFHDEKTGLKSKGMELIYKENTPFRFIYRHFEKPLEGMEFVSKETFFYKLAYPHQVGERTLWYYR